MDQHAERLAAIMLTYPSTHGVFELDIQEICGAVHDAGGQVYVDGANLNAMVGLAKPGASAPTSATSTCTRRSASRTVAAVPAWVRSASASTWCRSCRGTRWSTGTSGPVVSGAPWGSAGILPISWAYLRLMGPDGLLAATEHAILAANYVATRLRDHFPVLYAGAGGLVAHECILDIRPLTKATGVTNDDIAKRLIDFGFHAPTMSFPVAGTLMVEPTESEDKAELDRFVEAMITIRGEIEKVATGEFDRTDNPLRNARTPWPCWRGSGSGPTRTRWPSTRSRGCRARLPQPGPPRRPGIRRPQPGLRLPAAGGVRRHDFTAHGEAGNRPVPAVRAGHRTTWGRRPTWWAPGPEARPPDGRGGCPDGQAAVDELAGCVRGVAVPGASLGGGRRGEQGRHRTLGRGHQRARRGCAGGAVHAGHLRPCRAARRPRLVATGLRVPVCHVAGLAVDARGPRRGGRPGGRETHRTWDAPRIGDPFLRGIAPTGKAVAWSHHHSFRLVNGKIAEHWANRDDLGFLRQVTPSDA